MHGREGEQQRSHRRHMWPVPASTTSSVATIDFNPINPNSFLKNEYRAKVGGPGEDGTPETDDLAIWSEITGGTKKNRILGFPGFRARDLIGPPPMVPPSISDCSPQQSIDHKVLESMVENIVLRRLGIESIDDATTDDSTPQPSVGIDINDRISKMVEMKFTNFLQTFTNYESIEHEVYKPNLDFLEENDDEVAD